MTTDEFREIALSLPEAEERSHMGHPDFRVGGKIFATIAPDGMRGMAKLTPEQQQAAMRAAPKAFEPAAGAWGARGATMIALEAAAEADVLNALSEAWRNTAPPKLRAKHG